MCQIELVNMKIYKNNSKSRYTIYKPSCPNASEYKIIIKSKEHVFIQFNLFARFTEQTQLIGTNSIESYDIFPSNGIVYSNTLNKHTDTIIINIKPIDLCGRIIIKNILETKINHAKLYGIRWDNIFITVGAINTGKGGGGSRSKIVNNVLKRSNVISGEALSLSAISFSPQ